MTRAVVLLAVACVVLQALDAKRIDMLMPEVQPQERDTYLCIPVKMDAANPTYIVGFEPHASKEVAHHMLLYGCKEPGQRKQNTPWMCGEMASKGDYDEGPVCRSGSQIIYAWAMDAPSLQLPEGVAFKVGGDTDIDYLVLQVHYKTVSSFKGPNAQKDKSGISVVTSKDPMRKRAGVILMGSGGQVPAHSNEYFDTSCRVQDSDGIVAYPFGYRTHAHVHGRVITGLRKKGHDWTVIGHRSPQDPQMFYNLTTPGMTIKNGDVLAARCVMDNTRGDHTVRVGATQEDEMCNFYIMYYVNGDKLLNTPNCWTSGPPYYRWETDPKVGKNYPKIAITDPKTGERIQRTGPSSVNSLREESRGVFKRLQDRRRELAKDEELAKILSALEMDRQYEEPQLFDGYL